MKFSLFHGSYPKVAPDYFSNTLLKDEIPIFLRKEQRNITLFEAKSIGVGAMVGNGIFAVLGLSIALVGRQTPFIYLIGGGLALMTAYVYVKFATSDPSSGGTVYFINKSLGRNLVSGTVNNLLWLSYILTIALGAFVFAYYAREILPIASKRFDFHFYASLIIIGGAILNYFRLKVVLNVELVITLVNRLILVVFVVMGFYAMARTKELAATFHFRWTETPDILIGSLFVFVAFQGFELITNISPRIEKPERNLPKALYSSLIYVIFIYFVIAWLTVSTLSVGSISAYKNYVLAAAAKPVTGHLGFIVIAIAAMLSSFAAINASIFGGRKVSYEIARSDELPEEIRLKIWNAPLGLIITVLLALFFVNTVDLEIVSATGSIAFLLIFFALHYGAYTRRRELNAHPIVPLLGVLLCGIGAVTLFIHQYNFNPKGAYIVVLKISFCFCMEWLYSRLIRRTSVK